jgi:uncharacterized protein (DUF1800 family)
MEVTKDPAMLLWLSGTDNTKDYPNENYGRELMELFTIGAGRHGYTERDVREQARALTGWRNDYDDNLGPVHFRYDKDRHDTGVKKIFGKRGHFDWKDSCRLCVHHRLHPSFFVPKLWSYFVPTPPPRGTQRALQHMYVHHGYQVKPVVAAILKHPALYTGPRMVKSPAVYTAGLLRSLRRGIDTDAWTWLMRLAGQELFYPPNVAGWDDTRWLDTATYWARWEIASHAIRNRALDADKDKLPANAAKLMRQAEHLLGNPTVTGQTHAALKHFVKTALHDADEHWKKRSYPALIENALRQLLAVSPDLQTS